MTAPTVSFQHVNGSPFGVAVTPDGRYAFVDLVEGQVLVYSLTNGEPKLVRSINVPGGEAVGSSLTRDGRLLFVATSRGAAVISVAAAESGQGNPVLGTLTPSGRGSAKVGEGGIETASSANGQYVFVSLEYGQPDGAVSVYNIASDQDPHFGHSDYIGSIKLGEAVVGSAVSPNGRYLYVTSELADPRDRAARPPGTSTGVASPGPGTLSVISITKAEHTPNNQATLSTVTAMSQPVRVAVTPDGSTVWITARGSNRLLAFSANKLLTAPRKSLVASVRVGTAPVGVAVFDHGERVIVDDSNRFAARGAHAGITIVNAQTALHHQPAVVGTARSAQFPREIAIEPTDTQALITNFNSDQLETIDLDRYL